MRQVLAVAAISCLLFGGWLWSRTAHEPAHVDRGAADRLLAEARVSGDWSRYHAGLDSLKTPAFARQNTARGLLGVGLGLVFAAGVAVFAKANAGTPMGWPLALAFAAAVGVSWPFVVWDAAFLERRGPVWTGPYIPNAAGPCLILVLAGPLGALGRGLTVQPCWKPRELIREGWVRRLLAALGGGVTMAMTARSFGSGWAGEAFLGTAWTSRLALIFLSGPPAARPPVS